MRGADPAPGAPYTTWSEYGGSSDSAQYSALKQIDRTNVTKLEVAWTYPTGDNNKYFFNPIVVRNVMYVLARNNSIVALEAATGKELWAHGTGPGTKLITNRGINYWEDSAGQEQRLLFTSNNFLQAIDARTGKLIVPFGDDGRVDLKQGLGRDAEALSLVQSTTPGRIFENLLILGSATNEGYGSAPGDIRAYDVRNGRLAWSFHTVPHPGEFGYDTWPKNAWREIGGANSWSELSVDEKHGIVYIPTASPKYNFYGGNRAGANLFGDCLLALDARTGKRLWHFQMVHHDIWDYDNATAPKLLTVRHDGKLVDVVAQAGKEGFLWVFDRVTGEPLWPVREQSAPRSKVPGEETWPTQPIPSNPPPFSRQSFRAADINPFIKDSSERERLAGILGTAHNSGLFTPPSLEGTIEMPGNNGGSNWGGAAVDPATGALYVVSKDLPCLLKLEPEAVVSAASSVSPELRAEALYQANCQWCHRADRKGEPPATPALTNIGERLNPQQIEAVIAQGQGSMPAFPRLSASQRETLVAYLLHPARAPHQPHGDERASSTSGGPTRYVSGFGFMFTSGGLPAIGPPWSSLTAYDLNTGTIKWKIPLGEVPELAAQGITNTGMVFPKVGPVVTAGGLIFTASRDRKVRALDKDTGQVLWEKEMSAGLEGIPAIYESGGREFLVVCAAAESELNPKLRKEWQGAYVAFALPR